MNTRDAVLSALRTAGSAGVSGEAMAADLRISRAAIAKHIAVLRQQGYGISALPGLGYRLENVPDLPVPAEVAALVRDPFWVRIEGGEVSPSTNDDARRHARSGAPEGTAVVAGRQTGGRGRLGRVWESPEGGVYLSMVLHPPLAPALVSPLALVVGLGVAEALESFGAAVRLKWPNDVLLGGGKVAGVLLEMSAEADRVEWVVAGVGINVDRPAEAGAGGAAYLKDALGGAAASATRPAVAAAVLDGVASAYRRFLGSGFGALAADWNARDALDLADVVVRNAQGDEVASGRAEGVDGEGRLLVADSGAVIPVVAGEVTLRQ